MLQKTDMPSWRMIKSYNRHKQAGDLRRAVAADGRAVSSGTLRFAVILCTAEARWTQRLWLTSGRVIRPAAFSAFQGRNHGRTPRSNSATMCDVTRV